eukprot:Sspe_Gene.47261::Locus_23960_Transcript_2_3_Confidence_0.467_Length_717::g.47261::m.47261
MQCHRLPCALLLLHLLPLLFNPSYAKVVSRGTAGTTPYFLRNQCQDAQCAYCDEYLVQTSMCEVVQQSYSVVTLCYPNLGMLQQTVWLNTDCSGSSYLTCDIDLNVCVSGAGGYHYSFQCSNSMARAAKSKGGGNGTASSYVYCPEFRDILAKK